MFKVGDSVRVKLREPVGSAITETNNRYLRNLIDRECKVLLQCENPQMFMIGPNDGKTGPTIYAYDFELEGK